MKILPLTTREKLLAAYDHKWKAVAWGKETVEYQSYRKRSERYIASLPACPTLSEIRGIVMCVAGVQCFTNAWVCIQMLRKLDCQLPVQLWHRGATELDSRMKSLVEPLGIECADALKILNYRRMDELHGWALKPFAILHSPFKEVLFLDTSTVPLHDPEYLFETTEFKENGAIFWPGIGRFPKNHSVWQICGVEYRNEPGFESGQMVLDKTRTWRELLLTLWYSERSDFYYRFMDGDKDTFYMAFRKLNTLYSMPRAAAVWREGVAFQHDFRNRRIFQHRSSDKWDLNIPPKRIGEFEFHDECLNLMRFLRRKWDGRIIGMSPGFKSRESNKLFNDIIRRRYRLHAFGVFCDSISFSSDARICTRVKDLGLTWRLGANHGKRFLGIYAKSELLINLSRHKNGTWQSFDKVSGVRIRVTPEKLYRLRSAQKEHIWIRAPINGYTGYGLHALQIISDFQRNNYNVHVIPLGLDEKYCKVPDRICDRVCYENHSSEWELLLHDPKHKPTSGKKTVFFSMWESTELPEHAVNHLNEAEIVVVPCKWNEASFRAQGVSKPIYVIPLGINTRVFRYFPMRLKGPCIFGTGGRVSVGGTRKGVNQVIAAFLQAFPHELDVRLFVKVFADCQVPSFKDHRIIFTRHYLSEQEMARWYRSLTCFVSASRGEGWGLMQHQALATGRPIISIQYGGVVEFFNDTMGYPVPHTIVPADKHYAGCGNMAQPDQESLIKQMRQVYLDRDKAAFLGRRGSTSVSMFSWHRSNEQLLRVLQKAGMISVEA